MSEIGNKDMKTFIKDGNGMPLDMHGYEALKEDFTSFYPDIANNVGFGVIPWQMVRVGAVFTAICAPAALHGAIIVDSGAAVPANDSLFLASSMANGGFIVGSFPKLSVWAIILGNVTNMDVKLGFDDDAAWGTGIYFRYDTGSADTNWMCVCDAGGANVTVTDSGVAVAVATEYSFYIDVISASEVRFYINGSLVATITTAAHITGNPIKVAGYWEVLANNDRLIMNIDRMYAWQTPDPAYWSP